MSGPSKVVLVTGAEGMLGGDFCLLLESTNYRPVGLGRSAMDVTDLDAVRRVIGEQRPRLVVHAAAHTNVDQGEREPEVTYRANTLGTWNVALACAEHGASLVYVSSCGVFDGKKVEPYTEMDPPNPITHYHRSKYRAEGIVAGLVKEHWIVRPGWLFGGRASHRRNFVEQRRREALEKALILSASDRFGTPTYTLDFASATMQLVEDRAYGTYHLANAGACSRFEYVKGCVEALGLSARVEPTTSGHFPRSAPVPESEALDTFFWRLRGYAPLRTWREALADYTSNRLIPEIHAASRDKL